jgi:hypothetical protein
MPLLGTLRLSSVESDGALRKERERRLFLSFFRSVSRGPFFVCQKKVSSWRLRGQTISISGESRTKVFFFFFFIVVVEGGGGGDVFAKTGQNRLSREMFAESEFWDIKQPFPTLTGPNAPSCSLCPIFIFLSECMKSQGKNACSWERDKFKKVSLKRDQVFAHFFYWPANFQVRPWRKDLLSASALLLLLLLLLQVYTRHSILPHVCSVHTDHQILTASPAAIYRRAVGPISCQILSSFAKPK